MIGIVIAMESEAEILLRDAEIIRTLTISGKSIYIGKAYGKEFALCQCGVGKVNAALGAQLLISKFDVKSLVNLMRVRKMRESAGLPVPDMSLHLV